MIHSIKTFNLLAQSKPRIKIKIFSVSDYIPIISKCKLVFFTIFARGLFILLVFLRNQFMVLSILLLLIH